MKRSEAVESTSIGVSVPVEKKLRHSDVSAMGSNVERSQVVNRDIINRCPVVEQDSSTIHVVALGSHVQRSQPVLKIHEFRMVPQP